MFREMRRKDREIGQERILDILKKQQYGILSTVDSEGQPYGLPISYVYHHEAIYIHCATEGHKLDNLLKNPKVSFCVVGDTNVIPDKFTTDYESVIAFGEAGMITGEEKEAALIEILHKYSPDFLEKGKLYIKNAADKTKVMKISISHMTGKARG